jgi:RNA polymerase sigma-70 factor (ECF subfamily)
MVVREPADPLMNPASRRVARLIDPKLLSRVAKGDLDALSHLYDESCVLLFTLAYRILGNREDATRLLQDVYLEVWRKVARYDIRHGTPAAWLVTLTRTRAIERIRSGPSPGPQDMTDSPVSAAASDLQDHVLLPSETKQVSELRLALINAIAELPAVQREAIEMAYYHGLSHTEIAARLHQPLGTVKTRLKLAMMKLRTLLHSALEHSHP